MNRLKPILLDLGLLHEVNDVFLKVTSAVRQAKEDQKKLREQQGDNEETSLMSESPALRPGRR